MHLTPPQKRAIEHAGGNLQLIACAGSGKTEVVARRVVHLLTPGREDSLLPRNIVAFTFTDRAAAELKERIVTRTREALGELPGMAEMFVGTIHGFCLDFLKSEATKYFKFEVLNEVQQSIFVDRHSSASGLTTTTDLNGRTLKRYVDTKRYITALNILREDDVNLERLLHTGVMEGFTKYRQLLNQKTYLDYSAILKYAAAELEQNESARRAIAERVRYVVVDEYQDVNPIQEQIVRQLHDLGARLCVVGDDDQTIYQWRGSDIKNILTFAQRYPDASRIPIEANYRSSEGIVETARPFIEKNSARLAKKMTPAGTQPFEVGDVAALSFANMNDEARHIAATAKALLGVAFRDEGGERGLAWSDMAVLMRSVRRNAKPITDAFEAAGIPYVVTGMTDLFDMKEAEAARELFYYLGSHGTATADTVRQAWIDANVGLDEAALTSAVAKATAARSALTDPDQKRWGQYSIQRVFLTFLDDAGLREELVRNGRGDVVFYNLGKFSQVISDFEAIHFQSQPSEKYAGFAAFLEHRAADSYSEGKQDDPYAAPNAVRVMTIHQAKGMQWPVVFIPALLRNRFPQPRVGGANAWHLVPKAAVPDQSRYEGSIEDERRLFYVAMTRSQKFLHMTWGPIPGNNNRYQRVSEFWDDVLVSKWVSRRVPDYSQRRRLPPQPRAGIANVVFSFSDLKYFFDCAYQFKLRVLYGFNAPIHEALGYGKSLHDALAEVHRRALAKDFAGVDEAARLLDTHLHAPYAYPALREQLRAAGEKVIAAYLRDNADLFDKVEFAEKQIGIDLGDGVSIVGRIDLVRRLDTGETTIVDLKSSDRAQPEEVTEAQLHTYALGYQELTGRRPDYVEIYELDAGRRKPRAVDDAFLEDVKARTRAAAEALRTGQLPPSPEPKKCATCDYLGMCSQGRRAAGGNRR